MNQSPYVAEVVFMHQKFWSTTTTYPLKLKVLCALLGSIALHLLSGCDPTQPSMENLGDATVISPPPQPQWDVGVTSDQEVELPGPFLNSILPTRAPISGGVTVRVIGADFRQPMYIRVGGLPCVTLTIETEARMTCVIGSEK